MRRYNKRNNKLNQNDAQKIQELLKNGKRFEGVVVKEIKLLNISTKPNVTSGKTPNSPDIPPPPPFQDDEIAESEVCD